MGNKGLTVKELRDACNEIIKSGGGSKHVLISDDDECNGYHTLFYLFTTDDQEIKACADTGMFHDDNPPKEVVLLG